MRHKVFLNELLLHVFGFEDAMRGSILDKLCTDLNVTPFHILVLGT